MKIEVDVDDEFIRQVMEDNRSWIFSEILERVVSDVYPRPHNMGDLEENMKYYNALNVIIEFYGGENIPLREMFERNSKSEGAFPIYD